MTSRKEKPFTAYSNVLDAVLLRALAQQGFTHPTPIQARVLEAALQEPKDVLARSRTGSGKTLAYGICLVQTILRIKSALKPTDSNFNGVRALILVPTKELAEQVTSHLRSLCEALGDEQLVRAINIAAGDVHGKKSKSNQGYKIQK
jgi:ATP-dependent RNA helicase DDX56/DBP9